MTSTLDRPSPSAPREHLADWLELRALQVGESGVSIRDMIRDLKIGGVMDSFDEWEEGRLKDEDEDEVSEPIVEAAFAEMYERKLSCENAFPYELSDEHIQIKEEMEQGIYVFLSLLSRYGHDAGPPKTNGAKLFENVCAQAIKNYMGGSPAVKTHVFGFPRRTLPADFCSALDQLCVELGEGIGARGDQPTSIEQKDAKLDIVAWRDFDDGRQGKLIAFGQCATGNYWQGKRSELPKPVEWCIAWLKRPPYFEPIRVFFVPHRVEVSHWENTCRFGGLLFDRCRIASLATALEPSIAAECSRWAQYVLTKRLRK